MARGSIRQRSKIRKDSWTVQVYLGVDPVTGRKRYRSEAVSGTRAQAQRRLTELLHELDTGTFSGRPSGLTVGEYLDEWLRDYAGIRVRRRTLEVYRSHVRLHIVPKMGKVSLQRLTARHIQDMEADMLRSGGPGGRGLSPGTVLYTHRILYSALKNAVKLGLIFRNVAEAVEPPRTARYEVRTLTWDECLRFLEGVEDSLFRTIFLVAVQTGLRRSELLGLHWRDVDLEAGLLSIRRGLIKLDSGDLELSEPKSGGGRVVILVDESVEALARYRERCPGDGGFVFCHSDGRPLDPGSVTRTFRRAVLKAGLDGLRFHDLRHTHASLMLSEGVHLKVVSERLGHSNISITGDIYSHVQPTVQREAVERFGAAWRAGMAKEWQVSSDGSETS